MKTSRLALYATLSATILLVAGPGTAGPAGPAAGASLAGQLLVALPELEDPRFTKTVIYIVKHDSRGAVGLMLNRPLGDIPIAVLLTQAGLPASGVKGSVKLHLGGPVEGTRVSVLHSDDYQGPDTSVVAGGIAITSEPEILQAIVAGKGPRRAHFSVGFAGWGPGQLEGEIKDGSWLTVPSDDAIVFDDGYETKWERALAKRRISL